MENNELREMDVLIANKLFGYEVGAPPYSTDIAAAMEAAEKMRERQCRYVIFSPILLEQLKLLYLAQLWRTDVDHEFAAFVATGSTLPEAIARCIVKALDAENK